MSSPNTLSRLRTLRNTELVTSLLMHVEELILFSPFFFYYFYFSPEGSRLIFEQGASIRLLNSHLINPVARKYLFRKLEGAKRTRGRCSLISDFRTRTPCGRLKAWVSAEGLADDAWLGVPMLVWIHGPPTLVWMPGLPVRDCCRKGCQGGEANSQQGRLQEPHGALSWS